jgi:hypothetical protein
MDFASIYAEQGFGDTLQFARYALMLAGLGARVHFEVQPALYQLQKGLHPAVHLAMSGEVIPSYYDLHCPLLSLAKECGTDLNSIPFEIPYVFPHAEVLAKWAPHFQHSTFRVGFVWSGKPELAREGLRSIPISQLAKILHGPGGTFCSLQKGTAAKQPRGN